MATIMPASELVRRAAAWLAEQRALYPEKSLAALLDEAGMRFNLNPLDAAALGRVVVNYADLEPEQFIAALRAALPTLRDAKS